MEGGQHQIGGLQLADSWRRPTSPPAAGGVVSIALQCTSMPHSAPWGRGTSTPHSGGTVLQCPTVGHGTSMPHSGRMALQCPTVGAQHSNAVRVTVCTLVADKVELPLALSLSVGRCRGRGGVGVVPSGVGVVPSGVGVAPSGVGVGPSGVGAVPSRSSWKGWAEICAHHLQVPLQRSWDVPAVPHTPPCWGSPPPRAVLITGCP